ncbi:MAG: hypothetical protein HY017_23140 [Betaproteobacteria bacterium]|nr:hypothetical protein [Betaproteobacteria bacterium]
MFELTYAALPSVKAGRVRPLAVTTVARLPMLQEVPTFAESGYPSLVASNWQGVIAPRAMPREMVFALNATLNRVLAIPEVRDSILAQGNEVGGGAPEVFTDLVRAEIPRWAEVVKTAGIKPE